MSLRYLTGYSLILVSRVLKSALGKAFQFVALFEQISVMLWTSREIDRYAQNDWDSRAAVKKYSEYVEWLDETEERLVDQYFLNYGKVLNLACGAGRETLLLAPKGLSVTATDWGLCMVTAAHRRAEKAGLPVHVAQASMFRMPYRRESFDYLLLTNISYSYLFPRRRRLQFLNEAYAVLKPRGIFIVAFAPYRRTPPERLQRLFMMLCRWRPFNPEYEHGDFLCGSFVHFFRPEELQEEFQAARFLIKEWLFNKGYAVLVKV